MVQIVKHKLLGQVQFLEKLHVIMENISVLRNVPLELQDLVFSI